VVRKGAFENDVRAGFAPVHEDGELHIEADSLSHPGRTFAGKLGDGKFSEGLHPDRNVVGVPKLHRHNPRHPPMDRAHPFHVQEQLMVLGRSVLRKVEVAWHERLCTGPEAVTLREPVVPLRQVFVSVSILRTPHELRLDLQSFLQHL
jgi:hypothetical protein